jgi:hypothetical protein
MAIQMRRGEYKDLNTEKLLPAEWAVVLSGDPKAKDGRAAYLCFNAGDVKRMATYEDMEENIEEASGVIAEKAAEKAASAATKKAEEKINDAAEKADQSASKAEEAAKKVDDGLGAYQDKLNNAVKEYDKRLDAGIAECKDILNSVSENFKQTVDFQTEQGSYWNINHDRTITKYGPSSQYLSYASTAIPVTEGEVYEVHCAKKVADSYYVPGPIIAVRNATDSAASDIIGIYETPIDGNNQYVLTVPEGAKYLLVNHVVKNYSGVDLKIYKRNSLENIVTLIITDYCQSLIEQVKQNTEDIESLKKEIGKDTSNVAIEKSDFEAGSINSGNGTNTTDSICVRTKNRYTFSKKVIITNANPSLYRVKFFIYDLNGKFMQADNDWHTEASFDFIADSNYSYRFQIATRDGSAIDLTDAVDSVLFYFEQSE